MPSKKSIIAIPFCKRCFKPIRETALFSLFGSDIPLCPSCYRQLNPTWHRFFLDDLKCYALYPYGEAMRSLIYDLKACGDVELAPLFIGVASPFLRLRFRKRVIVCAPSYEEKNEARGFNHVEEIFKPLSLPMLNCLKKTDNIKQADLNFLERQKVGNHLAFFGEELQGQRILLVDDICTTGATLKACAKLLLEHGAKDVDALVIARSFHGEYPHKAKDCLMGKEKKPKKKKDENS